jgi:hypothetical protein
MVPSYNATETAINETVQKTEQRIDYQNIERPVNYGETAWGLTRDLYGLKDNAAIQKQLLKVWHDNKNGHSHFNIPGRFVSYVGEDGRKHVGIKMVKNELPMGILYAGPHLGHKSSDVIKFKNVPVSVPYAVNIPYKNTFYNVEQRKGDPYFMLVGAGLGAATYLVASVGGKIVGRKLTKEETQEVQDTSAGAAPPQPDISKVVAVSVAKPEERKEAKKEKHPVRDFVYGNVPRIYQNASRLASELIDSLADIPPAEAQSIFADYSLDWKSVSEKWKEMLQSVKIPRYSFGEDLKVTKEKWGRWLRWLNYKFTSEVEPPKGPVKKDYRSVLSGALKTAPQSQATSPNSSTLELTEEQKTGLRIIEELKLDLGVSRLGEPFDRVIAKCMKGKKPVYNINYTDGAALAELFRTHLGKAGPNTYVSSNPHRMLLDFLSHYRKDKLSDEENLGQQLILAAEITGKRNSWERAENGTLRMIGDGSDTGKEENPVLPEDLLKVIEQFKDPRNLGPTAQRLLIQDLFKFPEYVVNRNMINRIIEDNVKEASKRKSEANGVDKQKNIVEIEPEKPNRGIANKAGVLALACILGQTPAEATVSEYREQPAIIQEAPAAYYRRPELPVVIATPQENARMHTSPKETAPISLHIADAPKDAASIVTTSKTKNASNEWYKNYDSNIVAETYNRIVAENKDLGTEAAYSKAMQELYNV